MIKTLQQREVLSLKIILECSNFNRRVYGMLLSGTKNYVTFKRKESVLQVTGRKVSKMEQELVQIFVLLKFSYTHRGCTTVNCTSCFGCNNQNITSYFTTDLLDAFAKVRKATISFVMSVCPFVLIEQLGSNWTDFQ